MLGAQPLRRSIAAFYATVANEGAWAALRHQVDRTERSGGLPPRRQARHIAADKPAFFQLKSILQGVLARGARSIGRLSPLSRQDRHQRGENDAWFVGFSNDVTVAVWVGYDNSGRTRRAPAGATGSRLAVILSR